MATRTWEADPEGQGQLELATWAIWGSASQAASLPGSVPKVGVGGIVKLWELSPSGGGDVTVLRHNAPSLSCFPVALPYVPQEWSADCLQVAEGQ